jgi:hypothetical protein
LISGVKPEYDHSFTWEGRNVSTANSIRPKRHDLAISVRNYDERILEMIHAFFFRILSRAFSRECNTREGREEEEQTRRQRKS